MKKSLVVLLALASVSASAATGNVGTSISNSNNDPTGPWSIQLAFQSQNMGDSMRPMMGPSFIFAFDDHENFGLRTLFSLTSGDFGGSSAYNAQIFWRHSYGSAQTRIFVEPAFGIDSMSRQFSPNAGASLGIQHTFGAGFSVGGSSGFDLSEGAESPTSFSRSGLAMNPKFALFSEYHF